MIVDTHVHVVSDDREKYPYVRDTEGGSHVPTVRDLGQPEWPATTVEHLLSQMDEAGVDRAALVQTFYTYGYNNSYCIDSALAYPDRFVSVCVLNLMDKTTPDTLEKLVTERGVKGIRLQHGRQKGFALDDPATFPLWERVRKLGIPVCIADRLEHYSRAHEPLKRFPDVTVAFDHIWGNVVGDPPYDMLKPLFDLAQFPNVYVKTAVNNSYAAREGNSTPQKFYSTLIERFGIGRIMWGSNYPAHPVKFGTFQSRVDIARKDFAFLSDADRELVLGGNALKLYPDLK